jgi:hypothetical protein
MEGFLKQSTAVNITVLMIDSSDHVTGKTGLTLTIYATKAAGTPATISPTVTELDSTNVKGLYKLALTTGHTDTLGELQLHITGTGADPTDIKWQVSTYLPGEAATLQADQAVNITKVNGHAVTDTASGVLDVNAKNLGGTAQTGRDLGASVLLSNGTGAGQVSLASGAVTVGTNNDKTGYGLTSSYDFAKGTAAMTEAYAANNATATPIQMLHMIWALLSERSIASTTLTAKKLDGTTTAMTFTLDSATTPTSQVRAT